MNQKWRILLGICLVVMVCMPVVFASIPSSGLFNSYSKPSIKLLDTGRTTQKTDEKIKTIPWLFDEQVSHIPRFSLQRNSAWFSSGSQLPATMPSSRFSYRTIRAETSTETGGYISREEAVQIALEVFPDIVLTQPITIDSRHIDSPGLPFDRDCLLVTLTGYNSKEDAPSIIDENGITYGKMYIPYGGIVFIDAITGEVLSVFRLL